MKIKESNIALSFIFSLLAAVLGVAVLYFAVKITDSKGLGIVSVLLTWGSLGFLAIKYDFWKTLSFWLLAFTLVEGFLGEVPRLHILNETIRNLYFHVTMWFAMLFLLLASVVYSIMYLVTEKMKWDIFAKGTAQAGTIMGCLGLVTGMLWAKYTWGSWWHWDPKQLYTGIGLLMYFAYFVLRGAFDDEIKRAKIASVINVFAFPSLIVLLYVLPRMMVSTHPGQEGNPAFSDYDLNDAMRIVFYPAIIGWTLLASWIASIRIKTEMIELDIINETYLEDKVSSFGK